jgi:hypothetical protein
MKKITTAREASNIFEILGIKDITTKRQRHNGTTVFELPISTFYGPSSKCPLRFATYSTGYVRNISESNSSCYQINKTKQLPSDHGDYTFTERILIPTQQDRLIYLANFVIKNYYKKTTYLISDYTMDTIKSQYRQANDSRNQTDKLPFNDPFFVACLQNPDDIQVIINGHRYNLS